MILGKPAVVLCELAVVLRVLAVVLCEPVTLVMSLVVPEWNKIEEGVGVKVTGSVYRIY